MENRKYVHNTYFQVTTTKMFLKVSVSNTNDY